MFRELLDKNITYNISLKPEDVEIAISYLNKNIQEVARLAIPTINSEAYKQELPVATYDATCKRKTKAQSQVANPKNNIG